MAVCTKPLNHPQELFILLAASLLAVSLWFQMHPSSNMHLSAHKPLKAGAEHWEYTKAPGNVKGLLNIPSSEQFLPVEAP